MEYDQGQKSGRVSVENPLSDGSSLSEKVKWFEDSETALEDANLEAERWRDYYDLDQWTQDELEHLEARGQPPTTTSRPSQKINYIIGIEEDTRVVPEAFPRTQMDDDDANACTDILRAASDIAGFEDVRPDVLENMAIEGRGAAILEPEVTEDERGEKDLNWILKYLPWDQFAYDARSKRRDFSDARWKAAVVWMDLDDAIAHPIYGEHAEVLKQSVEKCASDSMYSEKPQIWATRKPDRVRIVHMFYREKGRWAECHFIKEQYLVKPKWSILRDTKGRNLCRIIAAAAFRSRATQDRPSWCYGAMKAMISATDQINKRQSKALWMITMGQVWMEDGAITSPASEVEIQEAVAQPDSVFRVRPGALVEGKVKVERNLELAQGQAQLLAEAKAELDRSGPSAPVIAGDTRVRSGRAELVQQQVGMRELSPMFQSLRRWEKTVFRYLWYAVRRSWTYEKILRVQDEAERTGYRYVWVNRRMTRWQRFRDLLSRNVPIDRAISSLGLPQVEAFELFAGAQQQAQARVQAMIPPGAQVQQEQLLPILQNAVMVALSEHPAMRQEYVQNKIGELDIDIVLDVAPDATTIQTEQFEKITEMIGTQVLQLPPNLLAKLVIEASQLRNKKALLKMLDPPPPDPLAQQAAQLELALKQAEVEKTQAQTEDLKAHAQQRLADAKFKVESQAMKTEAQALEAAAKAGEKSLPQ